MTAGQATAADLSAAVRAARDGDQEAFRLLYREVQPGLLRYLRGLVGEDAEDLASETWLQVARDIRAFRDEGAGFRAWAVTVARHRALDHLRRNQRRPVATLPADVLVELADPLDTADEVVRLESTNATVALIATLPRDQAEAVLLRVVVGLDAKTAARVMGKRPGAVRTATWRGLRTLAERLEQADARPSVTNAMGAAPRKSR